MSVMAVVVVATVVTVGCVVSAVEVVVVVVVAVGLRRAVYTSATRGGGVIWTDGDWLADSEV